MNKYYKNILLLITIIIINSVIIFYGFYQYSINYITTSNCSNMETRLDRIKNSGVLTIASSNEKPYVYIEPKSKRTEGIDWDILTEAAKRLGVNSVELKIVPFGDLLKSLNSDDTIDIATDGLFITDERKKEVLFTEPMYKSSEIIIVPKVSKISFKEDLVNSLMGAQRGTVSLELAEKWKKEGLVKEIRVFESKQEMIEAVNSGIVDAAITDYIPVAYQIAMNKNLYLKVLEPFEPIKYELVGAAVRKCDSTLVDAINQKIEEMKEDKTIKKIFQKYGLSEKYLINLK